MATIYDVAKLAEVSAATVSNAYNRPEQMTSATRQRILEAARQLGYRPNINAQALAKGKSSIVGLLVSDIRVPHVSNVTRGVEDAVFAAGFMPIMASTDGKIDRTLQLLDQLRGYGACGFIIVPAQFGIPQAVADRLEELQALGIPTVVAGGDPDTDRINYVSIHGQQAARDLARYLIQLGHRDVAYIGTHFSRGFAVQRWLGFQQAFLARGLEVRAELVVELQPTPAASFQAMGRLMSLLRPPTAVFAMNDIFARGVIDFVTDHHISMPEQLSLATYDYLALAQRTTPRMTSIVVSAYELGCKSAELFTYLQATPNSPPRREYIDYQLKVRDTTAPPMGVGLNDVVSDSQ